MSVASHHFNVSATAQQSLASRLNFKKSLLSGRTSFGLFINSASPTIAEQMTQAGYDWLLIDAQHSSLAPPQLQAMLGAALVNNTSALVRVNSPYDRNGIQQAIDLGAYGCMIPTIKSKEDVSAAVDSLFFPPIGSRSIAFPIRPQLGRGVQEYLNAANDEVVNVIQIETKSSLEKLEEALHVPGVDVAFVGPFDLSFDLGLLDKHGYPKGMQTDDFQNVLTSIAAMCKASGVVAGCFASPAAGPKELIEMGFTMIGTGTDLALLDKAAAEQVQDLSAIRSTLGC